MIELFNGDSKVLIYDVIKKYGAENCIIVSDPPFNMNYHYSTYKDNLPEETYVSIMADIFSLAPSVIIHYPEMLYKFAFQMGKFPERVISWVYNSNTPRQHRDIVFFDVKPDFSKVTQPYKNINDKRIQKRIAEGKTGCKLYDWWEINQIKNVSKEKTEHPCQMPLEVMKRVVGILPEDKIIIDPFMGSGTTGLACKELNRSFVGIELDKKYFELCNKRINNVEPIEEKTKENEILQYELF